MKDKEKIIVFDGPFRKLCYKYISYKRSLGYVFGKSFIYSIRNMDRFFKNYHFDRIRLTRKMVLSFTAYREGQSLKT